MRRLLAVAGGAAAVWIGGGYWLRDWGATKGECRAELPGDDLVAEPADQTTRAVTVLAPPAQVWPWLVQLGQDRGGFYSYDWLENLFGLGICSADRIHPEWQELQAGDTVRLIPRGRFGLPEGLALPVARVEPGRCIVLREQPPAMPWDAVWSFHVVAHGGDRSRVLVRSRSARGPAAARAVARVMDPVTLLMTRRMLLGVKDRAEVSYMAMTSAA